MMNAYSLRRLQLLSAVSAALFFIACGPPWTVLVQSGPPSALQQVASFSVITDTSELMLGDKTAEDYLAGLDAAEQQKKREVLENMANNFQSGLSGRGVAVSPNGQAQIVFIPTFLRFGKYAVFFKQSTILEGRIEWRINGQVVDSIQVRREQAASRTRPSIHQRVRIVSRYLGGLGAKYVSRAKRQ